MDSETKKKIDAIWQGMWDNGMADAKTNITQITYLLFIKMLDDAQLKKEKNANALKTKVQNPTFKEGVFEYDSEVLNSDITYEDLRWHNFVHFDNAKMFRIVKDYVFKFIREMNDGEDNAFSRFPTQKTDGTALSVTTAALSSVLFVSESLIPGAAAFHSDTPGIVAILGRMNRNIYSKRKALPNFFTIHSSLFILHYFTSTVQPNSSGSLPNCIPVILS